MEDDHVSSLVLAWWGRGGANDRRLVRGIQGPANVSLEAFFGSTRAIRITASISPHQSTPDFQVWTSVRLIL